MEIIITILILVGTLLLGVSVPFSFGAAVIYMVLAFGYDPGFLFPVGYSKLGSVVLLAIPLFIMAGGIIEKGKIGKVLVDMVDMFVGRAKGGLGAVAVISSAIFGSISGSASATLSCIGSIIYPKLKEANYPDGFSAALISNAAPLGLLIPPSAIQILYAWLSNQSVLACFLATIIPGLLISGLLIVINFVYLRNCDGIKLSQEFDEGEYLKELKKRSKRSLPALLMPFIVLGSIYGGIMTPTESAAVAVFYSVPIGFIVYKGLTTENFKKALVETATTTGAVMVMLYVIMLLSRLIIMENIPNQMMEMIIGLTDNKILLLLLVNLFMVLIGMLMDDTSGVLLATPILLPLVVKLGVSPIQFAAIIGVNLGMGNITPPTAPILYLGSRVCKTKIGGMLRPTFVFILFAWVPAVLMTTFIPQLSLFLPTFFGFIK